MGRNVYKSAERPKSIAIKPINIVTRRTTMKSSPFTDERLTGSATNRYGWLMQSHHSSPANHNSLGIASVTKNLLQLVMVEAPLLDSQQQEAVKRWEQILEDDPRFYNGSKLFCREVVGDVAYIYQGDYATRMALGEKGDSGELGIGTVWCGAVLTSSSRKALLSQRAEHLKVEPGRWFLSSAGGLDVGEEPLQGAARELKEELGVQAELSYIGSLVGQAPYGLGMVYTAQVSEDIPIVLEESELTRWGWFAKDNLPDPQARLLQAALRLLHP